MSPLLSKSRRDHRCNRKIYLKIFIGIGAILVFLIIWGLTFGNRLDIILYSPLISPKEWCEVQPCVEINIFGTKLILVKPSSSIFVYFLGFQTVFIGAYLLSIREGHASRVWWGIALLLWGLGAIFAGTSYQLFSYEIKCAGRQYCVWTSWWEIIYLILSVGSIDAMFIALTYSCITPKYRKISLAYALFSFFSYCIIVLVGAYLPNQFMISFELMVLFLVPNVLFFFLLNAWRYRRTLNPMDKSLTIMWISLGIIIGLYFLYYILGITDMLWNFGIWFSENDVLHIGLIAWMFYVYFTVSKYVKDRNSNDNKSLTS
ncbi:MAG: hypothetical protein GF383_02455 [Candidatus Lokiarchaeota archaeon]|nr:hypothetical protein [Candidatus Lokiarchaeota archaeon]MBD3338274.1 hypothetical protein [Candidatus Lokiarchaeota archaeon]